MWKAIKEIAIQFFALCIYTGFFCLAVTLGLLLMPVAVLIILVAAIKEAIRRKKTKKLSPPVSSTQVTFQFHRVVRIKEVIYRLREKLHWRDRNGRISLDI